MGEQKEETQKEPLVLVQILFFAGLHCKAPQYNKPTNLLYGGPVEAEVFTGRIKKSTERSRLAKSLLWFKQGTRPVVMSHFASEAWGWGGIAEEGSANWGCFLCSGCHCSLLQGPGGREAAGGGICLGDSTLLLSDQIFLVASPRYSENSMSNRNWGRKVTQFAVWKEGLTSLPWRGGRWGFEFIWIIRCLGVTERGQCFLKSGDLSSKFLY